MNQQTPRQVRKSELLEVTEIFYSIQGEGPFAGEPAVFIRLAGCNLQCPQCDTLYQIRGRMSVEDIVAIVENTTKVKKGLVVITGGEPFRQDISLLVNDLFNCGFKIQIETNGTLYPEDFPWALCSVVCSPKAAINRRLSRRLSALKYVGSADNLSGMDGLPLSALGLPVPPGRQPAGFNIPVYLQPLDEKDQVSNEANLEAVVESCLKHGHILGLQLHKIIGKD